MKRMTKEEMRRINGGGRCPNCGANVSGNAFAIAWHWFTSRCWGFIPS